SQDQNENIISARQLSNCHRELQIPQFLIFKKIAHLKSLHMPPLVSAGIAKQHTIIQKAHTLTYALY
ncbi:hypothetical protein NPIL_209651, partial [Nephila pilipes]